MVGRKTKAQKDEEAEVADKEAKRIAKIEQQLQLLIESNDQMKAKVDQAKFASDLVGKLAEDGVLVIDGPKVRVNVVQQPIDLESNIGSEHE